MKKSSRLLHSQKVKVYCLEELLEKLDWLMNIHNLVSENNFRKCLPNMKLTLLFLVILLVVALLQVEESEGLVRLRWYRFGVRKIVSEKYRTRVVRHVKGEA